MKINPRFLAGLIAVLAMLVSGCKEKENKAPKVSVITPESREMFSLGEEVPFKVDAEDPDGRVSHVAFFVGGELLKEDSAKPYEAVWTSTDTASLGEYYMYAVAYDNERQPGSDNVTILMDGPGGFNPDLEYGSVSDVDGNNYRTIDIGEQVWMAENLNTSRYADGSAIPLVADSADWTKLEVDEKAYCWFDNSDSMRNIYGALYSWAAASGGQQVMEGEALQGLCPDGWHLPSDEDWKTLEAFLGMGANELDRKDWRGEGVASALKEQGYSHWDFPNEGDNSSGFTALPNGFRSTNGSFYAYYGAFWTANEDPSSVDLAWFRSMLSQREKVLRERDFKGSGFAVRCVQD